MITYNNHLKPLVLPEYGRNIQQMVDHCVEIEERDARNACAASIVRAMLTLFPVQGDRNEYERKLWDHLLVMSDFRLDIDSPYGQPDLQGFDGRPQPLSLPDSGGMQFRHYGANIERLIGAACEMEPSAERDELVYLIASQMKKMSLNINKDGVDDDRVFNDLRLLSGGVIDVAPGTMVLNDYRMAPAPSKKKKKK